MEKIVVEKHEVKKRFKFKGVELRIVDVQEEYMNSKEFITTRMVLNPHGLVVPLSIQRGESLKTIMSKFELAMDGYEKLGINVVRELLRSK